MNEVCGTSGACSPAFAPMSELRIDFGDVDPNIDPKYSSHPLIDVLKLSLAQRWVLKQQQWFGVVLGLWMVTITTSGSVSSIEFDYILAG